MGFVTVTLGYLLSRHGVSVAAIAGMVAIYMLPATWKFFAGPVLDTSLTPKAWYIIGLAVAVIALATFAVTPLTPASMPLVTGLALNIGLAHLVTASAAMAAVGLTTPHEKRGAVAGMLLTEATAGAGAVAAYALFAWLWKPAAASGLQPASAAA